MQFKNPQLAVGSVSRIFSALHNMALLGPPPLPKYKKIMKTGVWVTWKRVAGDMLK
jgi:hypothetical protein